jgi:hypothetical protein
VFDRVPICPEHSQRAGIAERQSVQPHFLAKPHASSRPKTITGGHRMTKPLHAQEQPTTNARNWRSFLPSPNLHRHKSWARHRFAVVATLEQNRPGCASFLTMRGSTMQSIRACSNGTTASRPLPKATAVPVMRHDCQRQFLSAPPIHQKTLRPVTPHARGESPNPLPKAPRPPDPISMISTPTGSYRLVRSPLPQWLQRAANQRLTLGTDFSAVSLNAESIADVGASREASPMWAKPRAKRAAIGPLNKVAARQPRSHPDW